MTSTCSGIIYVADWQQTDYLQLDTYQVKLLDILSGRFPVRYFFLFNDWFFVIFIYSHLNFNFFIYYFLKANDSRNYGRWHMKQLFFWILSFNKDLLVPIDFVLPFTWFFFAFLDFWFVIWVKFTVKIKINSWIMIDNYNYKLENQKLQVRLLKSISKALFFYWISN